MTLSYSPNMKLPQHQACPRESRPHWWLELIARLGLGQHVMAGRVMRLVTRLVQSLNGLFHGLPSSLSLPWPSAIVHGRMQARISLRFQLEPITSCRIRLCMHPGFPVVISKKPSFFILHFFWLHCQKKRVYKELRHGTDGVFSPFRPRDASKRVSRWRRQRRRKDQWNLKTVY